ncbi:MAG TPA: YpiF family protein [Bacillota bacterium]|nr:YpiF family protein [Bacillota bacterium]
MKWTKKDMTQYMEAKEYIDTIVIPLLPFQIAKDKESTKYASQGEVLLLLTNELERELSGRMMLIPNYSYLTSTDKSEEIDRINAFVNNIQEQPFSHIFFLTFDSGWKKFEQSLQGNLLWIPSVPSEDLYSSATHAMVKDQVSQVSELIRSYW